MLLSCRKEIGYDGWRLDFVRGFWGGYVKDYLDATEPYFAVGEYWDSLSYTYGEMDHNQDAHRQRIIDWINATSGTAGAFDVTTKGILHAVSEKSYLTGLQNRQFPQKFLLHSRDTLTFSCLFCFCNNCSDFLHNVHIVKLLGDVFPKLVILVRLL